MWPRPGCLVCGVLVRGAGPCYTPWHGRPERVPPSPWQPAVGLRAALSGGHRVCPRMSVDATWTARATSATNAGMTEPADIVAFLVRVDGVAAAVAARSSSR